VKDLSTVDAIFNKIDTAPHHERVALCLASLPVLADAFDDAGQPESFSRFARWLYKVAYLSPCRVTIRFRTDVHTAGNWSVTGLQPLVRALVWPGQHGRFYLSGWPNRKGRRTRCSSG
jgi:hypothetical protein